MRARVRGSDQELKGIVGGVSGDTVRERSMSTCSVDSAIGTDDAVPPAKYDHLRYVLRTRVKFCGVVVWVRRMVHRNQVRHARCAQCGVRSEQ